MAKDLNTVLDDYIVDILEQFNADKHAREHAYRPALKNLMSSFEDIVAVNDPRRSEHGNPDFIFLKKSNQKIIRGYAEAKDIDVDLDKIERTNQMERYGGYANLFLTNYLEFRFFKNGEKYQTISLGYLKDGELVLDPAAKAELFLELSSFLELPPEKIRSGKRLAQIMGGKARRIRNNVTHYLLKEDDRDTELEHIYEMMKQMLVHDLTKEKFADMYAQTLVYGLFVARYGDTTPESFDRQEARDLVPVSNPFLRHFFDHIVGPNFDIRLGYIVDELCEVFSASDVQEIVHKHLRITEDEVDTKDPIIHFYEDFLQEYDPLERKKMGAYYTPIPVVRFIVREVDRILRDDFTISDGLASNQTTEYEIETGQDLRIDRRTKTKTKRKVIVPKVQILDPAVGTATFLNESIKFIYENFKGQEGRWPGYVTNTLLKQIYGFELMMAPYTIAHLKLAMTLKDTGVSNFTERLGVYLTNTLEEGIPIQQDLFSFGLAQAVSDESRQAAEIKSEYPIMIVMGNPPYSVSSNNKSKYIEGLVSDYKQGLNERNIQPLSDDYIKFIRFAEDLITKTGEGIVAMITNNSYIDGIIHRQMRKKLLESFDKIYILDLHGNSKKKEHAPDGSKDENVFDIQQGVSVILAVKKSLSTGDHSCSVYFSEMYGLRKVKFKQLLEGVDWKEIQPAKPTYYFVPRDNSLNEEYDNFISIRELMPFGDAGIKTHRDSFVIDFDKNKLEKRIHDFYELPEDELKEKYRLKDTRDFSITKSKLTSHYNSNLFRLIAYRPFDIRWTYYSSNLMDWPREKTMQHLIDSDSMALALLRNSRTGNTNKHFIVNHITGKDILSSLDNAVILPLYLHNQDGSKSTNFNHVLLQKFISNLTVNPAPEEILGYIYAILNSKRFTDKYRGMLVSDYPRVPNPKNDNEFHKLSKLGLQLIDLHLMKLEPTYSLSTTYRVVGTDVVEDIVYLEEKVYINSNQYFGNIPEEAWNFFIGDYQPAQKWLKDRRNRQLTDTEIELYQKLISILTETDRILKDLAINNF